MVMTFAWIAREWGSISYWDTHIFLITLLIQLTLTFSGQCDLWAQTVWEHAFSLEEWIWQWSSLLSGLAVMRLACIVRDQDSVALWGIEMFRILSLIPPTIMTKQNKFKARINILMAQIHSYPAHWLQIYVWTKYGKMPFNFKYNNYLAENDSAISFNQYQAKKSS